MFETVPMSRITVAGMRESHDDVLRTCSEVGNVHLVEYSGDEMSVGTPHGDADSISARLSKIRAVNNRLRIIISSAPISAKQVESGMETLDAKIDSALELINEATEAEAEITRLEENADLLDKIAPLGLPLELLSGYKNLNVIIGHTSKAKKAAGTFNDIRKDIELHIAGDAIAVACKDDKMAEVSMAMAILGATTLQLPEGEGNPGKLASSSRKKVEDLSSRIEKINSDLSIWASKNGNSSIAAQEYLEREYEILTGHNKCAVSSHAFVLEAWVPTANSAKIASRLQKVVSHVEVKAHESSHHGHHDDHHEEDNPPVEYSNPDPAKPFELMTDLVGRPKYGTLDPTTFMAITFPIFYGLMLGDALFGLVILGLATWLKGKDFAKTPMGAKGMTILTWMGIWTIIFGILYAEFAGFEVQHIAPFSMIYPHHVIHWHGPGHVELGYPFHRVGHSLMDYILISVYFGAIHLMLGFIFGFINVAKDHGLAAAWFEKGCWMLILIGGFGFIYLFLTTENGHDESLISGLEIPCLIMMAIGLVSLIIGLAVYEGFGWVGGFIMGPIETFGLLANTLSYLRLMAVGVAGVKIAEVGNKMGFHPMIDAASNLGEGLNILILLGGFLLWIAVQVFAILLGLLSPSIHAARLHFVEWMSKFYDGSGERFKPLGGRPLYVEGH